MLHSKYVRKRAPAQLEWRWLNSFRLPLLSRRRRCRPFLDHFFALFRFENVMKACKCLCWCFWSANQNWIHVHRALCKRVGSDDASSLNCPHTYTDKRVSFCRSVHVFMFRFNCADVQERFYLFVLPQATQVFGWLLVQVEILWKWLILLTVCVCAFWALHRGYAIPIGL